MILDILRTRREIRRMVRRVCDSLDEQPGEWTIDEESDCLSRGEVGAHHGRLFLEGESMWLPILQRLKLRRAYARCLVGKIMLALSQPVQPPCQPKPDKPKRR